MIVYPKSWNKDYECLSEWNDYIEIIIRLKRILKDINVNHLAYSGGIDSSIMLAAMSNIFDTVYTYTISSRLDHPDIFYARIGSEYYNTEHREFIVNPTYADTDVFKGDNAVRQLFELVSTYTDRIICCDGIDEFMCGYYDHQFNTTERYAYYLRRLLSDHLIPLNKNSNNVKVFLPYLDECLVNIYRQIPLMAKVDGSSRKKIMIKLSNFFNIPKEIIIRKKYGFCDAFNKKNK